MQNWLVINSNTSAAVTERLRQRVQRQLPMAVQCRCTTARFGAPYIDSEASYAVAAHAVLDSWQQAGSEAIQGYLVGCFGDPGVAALQELCAQPVVGLAEASFAEASRHGRFAIVTGGLRWAPMLRKLAQTLGYGEQLLGIHTLDANGAELAAQPLQACAQLRQACLALQQQHAVQAVILGGAGLTGLADCWAEQLPCRVIDSVDAGVRELARRSGAGQQGAAQKPGSALAPHPDLLRWPDAVCCALAQEG
jgi:allantoin racemase